MSTTIGRMTADLVRPYLAPDVLWQWLHIPTPLASRLELLRRANAPQEVLTQVQDAWETYRGAPSTPDDVVTADVQHVAEAAWDRAWTLAAETDKALGRRYDKDRYAAAAHDARMAVWRRAFPPEGVC
jgi:hypothetical protein